MRFILTNLVIPFLVYTAPRLVCFWSVESFKTYRPEMQAMVLVL